MQEFTDELRKGGAAGNAEPDSATHALSDFREHQFLSQFVGKTTWFTPGESLRIGLFALVDGPTEKGPADCRCRSDLALDLVVNLLEQPGHTGEDRRFDLRQQVGDVMY